MSKPRILVFASGSSLGGGSGLERLVLASRTGELDAEITGVVSNNEKGGVRERADRLGIPFLHFPEPYTAKRYQNIASGSSADFFALSGWLKLISGLDLKTNFNSKTVFNIHPAPLPKFGGPGLYGHRVHKAVFDAFKRGEITHSAVSMHFVTEKFDDGPVFFAFKVKVAKNDTPETLAERVNRYEHIYQPKITNLIANKKIHWNGVNPETLVCPPEFKIDQYERE